MRTFAQKQNPVQETKAASTARHDRVFSGHGTEVSFTAFASSRFGEDKSTTDKLLRACACGGGCPRCRAQQPRYGDERLQTQRVRSGNIREIAAPSIVHEALASPSQPLDRGIRGFVEPRFGHDFSRVRVHTDAKAAESAKSVNALAYTVGSHVVFAEGRYSPNSVAGRQLLAHELTHVLQQQSAPASAGLVQRKDTPPKAPTYRDCTEKTTFSKRVTQELEAARIFASDLVDAAIGALVTHDESEPYRTALARHFIAPTFAERKEIFRNFRRIWFYLQKPEHIRCAASDEDLDSCENNPEAGITQAFVDSMEVVLCAPFWFSRLPCQAITLIHEAAHGVGTGMGDVHPPYRGSTEYPELAGRPSAGETTAARMNNPSAYAYFAAHIGRETDTACFGVPVSVRGAIRVESDAPKPPPARPPLKIRPKLTVNVPGDAYEREADRVSEQVMRAPDPVIAVACGRGGSFPVWERGESGPEHLRAKAAGEGRAAGTEAPLAAHDVLDSPGDPLDADARAFFEPRFGHDFSRVHVHTDGKAAESSSALNALAYTAGEHVVFAPNQYDPATLPGRVLLAHELAHVVQQRGGTVAIQRQPQSGGAEELSRDLLEMSRDLEKIGKHIDQGAEDLEILRHQFFLAGKQLPKAGDRINTVVADLVEALIETSQTIGPFLLRKRAQTSVAKRLKIYDFREQFENANAKLSGRTGPSIGQATPTTIIKGFYHRRTDSIHLPPDAKFADALHEGIHKYSSVVVQTRLGVYINEGFTQHFTDRVRAEHRVEGHHEHAYGDQLACAKKVIGWLSDGETLAGRAYFHGEVDPLQQEIMRRLHVNDTQFHDLVGDREGEGLCERIKKSR